MCRGRRQPLGRAVHYRAAAERDTGSYSGSVRADAATQCVATNHGRALSLADAFGVR